MFRFKALFVVFGILGLVVLAKVARADGAVTSTSVARYSVPVSEELAPYSQFTLSDFQSVRTGDQVTYTYTLPPELAGAGSQTVTMSGTIAPGQPTLLQGDLGSAACALEADGQNVRCQVQYGNLQIDSSGVKAFLMSQSVGPTELAARLQVADLFAKEPVGVIFFRD
jgi:hypothetical protein